MISVEGCFELVGWDVADCAVEVLGAPHRAERRLCGCVGWSREAGDDEVEDGVEVVLGEGVAADQCSGRRWVLR